MLCFSVPPGFGISRESVKKMLCFSVPPGYGAGSPDGTGSAPEAGRVQRRDAEIIDPVAEGSSIRAGRQSFCHALQST